MTAVRLDRVSVVRGGRPVLHEVSLTVEGGQALVLLGPNGVGKSTALLVALGLVPAATGSVLLDGRSTRQWSAVARAARLAWLPQDAVPVSPVPAWEWVAAGRFRFFESRPHVQRAARAALASVAAEDLSDRAVTALSGGERQRVALAALFAQEADILLVDEPASHLDPGQQLLTYQHLGAQVRAGRGLVVVTHDVNLVAALDCPVRLMGLREGRVAFDLPYPSPTLPAALEHLYGVPFATVPVDGRDVHVPRLAEAPR